MADYIFEVPLSNKGAEVIPDVLDSIISEGSYMISKVTENHANVSIVDFDAETKRIYYSVNISSQMKAGLMSLNIEERLAWYDILIAGVAVGGAVACVYLGAIPAAVGLVVVAGVALARETISGLVEAEVNKSEAKKAVADAVADGRITPEEGDDFLEGINDGWSSDIMETIKWVVIIIGGAVALNMIIPLFKKK